MENQGRPARSCAFTFVALIVAVVGACMLFVRYVRHAQIAALGSPVPRLVVASIASGTTSPSPEELRPHLEQRLAYLLGEAPRTLEKTPEGWVVGLPERLDAVEVARVRLALAARGDVQFRWVGKSGTEHRVKNSDEVLVLEPEPVLRNEDLVEVKRGKDIANKPALSFAFTPEASARFFEATTKRVNERLAIVLDGEVLTVAVVRAPLKDRCVIDGSQKGWSEKDLLEILARMGSRDRYPFPVEARELKN